MSPAHRQRIIDVLKRDLAGYEQAARRKGLDPNSVGLIRILRAALAREEARKG